VRFGARTEFHEEPSLPNTSIAADQHCPRTIQRQPLKLSL
jgi:hypothetical protein